MQQCFLGVDVGATKSHALVADETGQTLGFGKAGPGNHEAVGYDGLVSTLSQCINTALQMAGRNITEIQGAGLGVAGYDWPGELAPTREAILRVGLTAPFEVVNDTIIGLVAGAEKGWGVGLVSGTGCNCWGWDENHKVGRVTGMGDWFGEYAGGGDIVHKAVISIAYETFHRGPSTQLTQVFLELTGAHDQLDLLEGLTLEKYHISSSAAPLVVQAAYRGDEVAVDILKWAGVELGELANCVVRQIGLEQKEFDVVLIGSVFKCGELLVNPLHETIHRTAPGANLVRLSAPPVVGGLLIGMQKTLQPTPQVRNTLIATSQAFMK